MNEPRVDVFFLHLLTGCYFFEFFFCFFFFFFLFHFVLKIYAMCESIENSLYVCILHVLDSGINFQFSFHRLSLLLNRNRKVFFLFFRYGCCCCCCSCRSLLLMPVVIKVFPFSYINKYQQIYMFFFLFSRFSVLCHEKSLYGGYVVMLYYHIRTAYRIHGSVSGLRRKRNEN